MSPPPAALMERLESTAGRALVALPHGVQRRLVGKPVRIDGLELHVEAQFALKILELSGRPEVDELPVPEARAKLARDARVFKAATPPPALVEHVELSGPAGPIRARLYRPVSAPAGRLPVLVYYHGGGWVLGDLETHDDTCRYICAEGGVAVVSVDYRLAPEAPFPAAADDALAAFRHVAEHASELGVDESAIAVGGDSAGGNLAAVTALAAHADSGPEPRFQILIYPVTDLSEKARSYSLFSDGFLLTERQMDWYRDHYVPDPAERSDPRVSPLLAQDLGGVAPAYVTTAGFDPLRDEGEAYVARLREAGVPVALRRHPGLVHGFANVVGVGSVGREALREICGALAVGLS